MHIYDYSFLKSSDYADMLGLTNIIYDLRAREEIRQSSNTALFESLRRIAIVDSVESSNAIEGIVATGERIKEMMSGDGKPRNHDEREIIGYSRALDEIYGTDSVPDISGEYIKHLHHLMLEQTSKEAGRYKRRNNWIQERDSSGRLKVRFVPVSAKDVDDAMEQLLLAYYDARQDAVINKLLLIGCFVVDFLCIHPFMDGNGRVSRLLTALLLEDAGFDIGRYISIDKKINFYKGNYYQVLGESSVGWHDNQNSYEPFIRFLLQVLYQCYKEIDEKFIQGTSIAVPKNKQIENALLNSYTPVSKRELCERFPDISVKTIEKVLGEMVREGSIVKVGTYKNARYRKS